MYPTDDEIRSASPAVLQEWVALHTKHSSGDVASEVMKHELSRRFTCEQIDCLKAILEIREDSDPVKLSEFARLVALFGPLATSSCQLLLDNIASILRHNWFYGMISSSEAHKLLRDQPVGAFLLRFSTDPNAAKFVVSIVSQNKATRVPEVVHIRIDHIARHERRYFKLPGQHEAFPSISELVLHNIQSDRFHVIKPTSSQKHLKFAHLFSKSLAQNGPYAAVFAGDDELHRLFKRVAVSSPDTTPFKKSRNLKDD